MGERAILFAIVLLLAGCTEQDRGERIAAEKGLTGCVRTGSSLTGKNIYCGKACFRKEVRIFMQCSNGAFAYDH